MCIRDRVNTVNDFWRMVWEHNSYNIIMLCQTEENGKVEEVYPLCMCSDCNWLVQL